MPLVLGVDSSTSACKVELRDADSGELVASGRAPHPPTTPPRSEQDPAAWRHAFDAACAAAGIDGAARRPDAVAVAAQQHGMVVLDESGAVLRPAKLWNDTESAPDAAALLERLDGGAAAWASACGSVPVPSFTITKLAWLRRCEPEVFDRVASVLLPHDWITSTLTGRRTTDRGDASGTGYWSPAEGRYRTDLLALIDDRRDWEPMLPGVLGPTEAAGEWRLGGPGEGALVAAGTGDNMAAALGLGLRPGDLVLSLGTSGTAYTVSTTPSADPTGTVAGFADATGHHLPLVCTLNATKVLDAVARLLGVDHAGFDELALAAPPGAGGVVLVPHLDGERTPNRPDATGALVGFRTDVTPSLVARAAVEGVVCNLLAGADELSQRASGMDRGRVLLIGGGAHSAAVRQSVADLLGRPVTVPIAEELVATGAAVQAAAALSGRPIAEVGGAWGLDDGTTVDPDPTVDRAAVRAAYADAVRSAR
jgi:xylulokinase